MGWVALSASRLLQPAAGSFLILAARRVMPTLLFLWEAHPAPMNPAPVAAWRSRLHDTSSIVTMPAAGQERRPQPGHHQPSPPRTGTRFSIPSRTVQAQSMRPRSDNHRSRDPFGTRKPRDHSARTRRSRSKARCHTPNPPGPLRPAPRTAAACKKRFCLLLSRLTKVGRPQARSAGRNAVEVEFSKQPAPAKGALITNWRNRR